MFVLITNDDGVFADGLRALVEEFCNGFEVVAVVPDRERTAISHAISLHKASGCTRSRGSSRAWPTW